VVRLNSSFWNSIRLFIERGNGLLARRETAGELMKGIHST